MPGHIDRACMFARCTIAVLGAAAALRRFSVVEAVAVAGRQRAPMIATHEPAVGEDAATAGGQLSGGGSSSKAVQGLEGGPLLTGCWEVPVTVGSVTFDVLVDSGSSDLAVPGAGLNGYAPGAPVYTVAAGQATVLSGVNQSFYDGSWWAGDFYTDSIKLGGGVAAVTASFAVIKSQSNPTFTDGQSSQGLLGIAYDSLAMSPTTVLTSLARSKAVSSDVVAFRGCPATSSNASVIDWGAESTSLTCTATGRPTAWAAVPEAKYHTVDVVGISVGGVVLSLPSGTGSWQPKGSPSIVDTCTTLLLLPDFAFTALTASIKASGVLQAAGLSTTAVQKFLYGQYGYNV
ncbi:hypothetical protein HK405_000471, partial [Cladochytrium tenue]